MSQRRLGRIIFGFYLGFLWKEWCSSWNSSTLATSCKELTHWKRLWCWEGLGARGEGDDRGWDGWMASLTRWTWVSVNSGRWWWTGRPGVLLFMGSQRVGHDWATDLIWSDLKQVGWGILLGQIMFPSKSFVFYCKPFMLYWKPFSLFSALSHSFKAMNTEWIICLHVEKRKGEKRNVGGKSES